MDERALFAPLRAGDGPVAPPAEFGARLLASLLTELQGRPVWVHEEDRVRPIAVPPPPRPRLWGPAVAAAAFAVTVFIGVVLLWPRSGPGDVISTSSAATATSTTAGSDDTSVTAPRGPFIQLPTGQFPTNAAWDGSRIWVLAVEDPFDSSEQPRAEAILLAVAVDSGRILSSTRLVGAPAVLVANEDAVWVAGWSSGTVSKVDPESGTVLDEVTLELPFDVGSGPDRRLFIPNDIAIGHGSVWASTARGAVARINLDSVEVEAMIELPPPHPQRLAVTDDAVWVAADVAGLFRISAKTNVVDSIALEQLGHAATVLASDGVDLYVAGDRVDTDGHDAAVSRLDTTSGEVLGTTGLSAPVIYVGWVNGSFGALDTDGVFHGLGPRPQLVESVTRTNWANAFPVPISREAWMIDHRNGRLLRVDQLGRVLGKGTVNLAEILAARPPPDPEAVSPDWIELQSLPPGTSVPAIVAWTGDEIVLWGGERSGTRGSPFGVAYDPATGTWREMAEAPIGLDSANWAWTGDELIVWGSGAAPRAAAWDPNQNIWRLIEDIPLGFSFHRRAVWHVDEILDFERNVAWNPATGATRDLPPGPGFGTRVSGLPEATSVVLVGDLVVAVPGPAVFDLTTGEWIEVPASGLTPLASRGADTSLGAVAVDYEMRAAVFDADLLQWLRLPPVPLRFYECFPSVHSVAGVPVAELCSGYAIWDTDRSLWKPIAPPTSDGIVSLIGTDEGLFAFDARLYRLRDEALQAPERLPIGNSYIDLPEGAHLVAGQGMGDSTAELTIAIDGSTCTVTAIHADAGSVIRPYAVDGAEVVQLAIAGTDVTTPVLEVPAGSVDEAHHLVWATGTTDVIDVACPDGTSARSLAERIWDRWS